MPLLLRRRRTAQPTANPLFTKFLASYFSAPNASPANTNPADFHGHSDHYSPERHHSDSPTTISDCSFWTRKIHALCTTHRNVDEALLLLDRLCLRGYRPDSLNLKSIVHALCDAGRYADAHRRLLSTVSLGCFPDQQTCDVLVARLLGWNHPHAVFHLIRGLTDACPAFAPNLTNYNRLIDQFCSISQPEFAHTVFFLMLHNGHYPNTISYTTLIDGYSAVGDLTAAQNLFDEMYDRGVLPNALTYSVLIRGVLLKARDSDRGQQLMNDLWEKMGPHEDEGEDDHSSSSSVNNAAFANLIDTLCTAGLFHQVFRIAEERPFANTVPDEFAYAQMVDSLCKACKHHGASRIVYIMRKRGLVPSLLSYNSIIHGLSKEGGCQRAFQLFQEGIRFGYVPSEYTYKILVESLCQDCDLPKARDVLHFMLINKPKEDHKTRIYNIYLRALCLMDTPIDYLLSVLDSMVLEHHCQPDVITLNTVLKGLCRNNQVEEALKVLNDMTSGKFCCSPDAVSYTTVIGGLLNADKVDEALHLLHQEMPIVGIRPGVVTCNVLLRGLFKLKRAKEAMETYELMISRERVVADSTSYTIVVDGLFETNQVDEAKRFWKDVIWPSKLHDNFVYAAFLKGLCRHDKLQEACDFLYELIDFGISPNVVSYNILIDNAYRSGMKNLAYQTVGEMKKNGISPDAVTWRILNKIRGDTSLQKVQGEASMVGSKGDCFM